jgi:hypothetical protein
LWARGTIYPDNSISPWGTHGALLAGVRGWVDEYESPTRGRRSPGSWNDWYQVPIDVSQAKRYKFLEQDKRLHRIATLPLRDLEDFLYGPQQFLLISRISSRSG